VVVIGGGPSGLVCALLMARIGRKTALVAPRSDPNDGRTTALMWSSVRMLNTLGLWDAVCESAAPLRAMRIIDATDRLIRAPEAVFQAHELKLEAFAYNIPNPALTAPLEDIIGKERLITVLRQQATAIECSSDGAGVETQDGAALQGDLLVGADGRRSAVREAAGIRTRTWSYDQVALVCNFAHTISHDDTSTEFHTPSGPFTMVPLGPGQSSLVCVVRPEDAELLSSMPTSDLEEEIAARGKHILGEISLLSAPQTFPLGCLIADRFTNRRAVLVGDAAHTFPPIGAQGLNL
jgi:2-octaprenyl-6-methoxyphenol hydroxylase